MFCAHLYSLVLVHVYKRMYGSSHDTQYLGMNEHLVAPGPVVEAMQYNMTCNNFVSYSKMHAQEWVLQCYYKCIYATATTVI